MMLGLLLARAGIDVVVLEKHRDFFRDFRGDTIHPSTLDLIDQLGLREKFEAIPHSSIHRLDVVVNGTRLRPVDFRHLPKPNREIALMPQWDFLDLLADEARGMPNFHLIMDAEATRLRRKLRLPKNADAGKHPRGVGLRIADRDGRGGSQRITGVVASTPDGPLDISAGLTVAADGRDSRMRAASALPVRNFGVAIDVLWFRMPRPAVTPPSTLGYLNERTMVVTIPRPDYYQTAMLIPKGGFDAVRDAGLPAFRSDIVDAAAFLAPVVSSLESWDQVSLLSVQVNRLERWYLPGFLCIGDAAHAMSPAFGVGINYALQDAVAAANILSGPMTAGGVTKRHLAAVQRRRAWPVRMIQPVQLQLHKVIARPNAGAILPNPLPRRVKLALAVLLPSARIFTARLIGRGFRPERIRSELLHPAATRAR